MLRKNIRPGSMFVQLAIRMGTFSFIGKSLGDSRFKIKLKETTDFPWLQFWIQRPYIQPKTSWTFLPFPLQNLKRTLLPFFPITVQKWQKSFKTIGLSPNISTDIRTQNPRMTKNSWASPDTFFDRSLSRTSNTTTYIIVPPASACNTATIKK